MNGGLVLNTVKISVRNLVEFIMRSGDITTSSGLKDPDAMAEGTRIHKKIQHKAGSNYTAEVALSITFPISCDDVEFEMTVEGRADGIFTDETGVNIDEIKGIYREVSSLETPVPVHFAQALCYGYIYANEHNLEGMGIRMTYCYIPTEEIRYFTEYLSFAELEQRFFDIVTQYAKWAAWQIKWQDTRNNSIKNIEFPFEYRNGQNTLVKGVYQSIIRKKRLYIEAPTGVGKTISTVFPAVKAMGEKMAEKIFYLTAKTITRTVAEETFHILSEHGMMLKYITLTAKEKICILDRPQCHPSSCPRALGHFDRINDAVYDVITSENHISRDVILAYAEKHNVCPFEMGLDISSWIDAIIGDYNYAFDPDACLKRFFGTDKQNDYIFLIDEAHNLVDRAREMYSAVLVKEHFLAAKAISKKVSKKITTAVEKCNRTLLNMKRECEDLKKYDIVEIDNLVIQLMRLSSVLEEVLQDPRPERRISTDDRDKLLEFYFEIRAFLNTYDILDNKYIIYSDYNDDNEFMLHLKCMDPSANLDLYLSKGRAAIFFSATLLPVRYYKEQLAGREDDYAIYAPSPFDTKKRLLMTASDVSTKYTRRTPVEYEKIANYIFQFTTAKTGNYLIFFPSYKMLSDVSDYIKEIFMAKQLENVTIHMQSPSMNEIEREEFLEKFEENPDNLTLGLCVMGGIFGEGIDLKSDRLIGAVIVGTGLPMVCTENELFKEYFDEQKGDGFNYAYLYPGMNKVLQAAGRVIRTDKDTGAILLLDERFLQKSYQELFPREWYPYEIVNQTSIGYYLNRFWK